MRPLTHFCTLDFRAGEGMKKHLTLWVFLCVWFGLSLIAWVYPVNAFSETENRYLEKKPEWSYKALMSGTYSEKYEAYVSDQFPFRHQWMRLKAASEKAHLRKENNNIVFGKEGHLFNKYIVLGEAFEKNVATLKAFSEEAKIPVSFMLVPNGYAVLSDLVPKGLYNVNQDLWLDLLSAEMGDDFIDVRPFFKRDKPLYYRLDHHWTTFGAHKGYEAIAAHKGFTPYAWESFKLTQVRDFYGTFYSAAKRFDGAADVIDVPLISGMSFYIDGEEKASMYDMTFADVRDKYGLFLHNNPGRSTLKGLNPGGKKALVFKDSYANSLLPFLAMHYDAIEIIDLRYFRGSVSTLMAESWDEVFLLYNFISFSEDRHISKLRY